MSFCTVTPTRGDRPELLEFCKHQLSRMSVKPDKSYFIDFKPVINGIDLTHRIMEGVDKAKWAGYNEVFIIEDDDYYPADYFERMQLGDNDFIGDPNTLYYHIKHNGHTLTSHRGRASLFTTGFKISALTGFKWPDKYLDVKLWNHAAMKSLKRKWVDSGAIGIKHSIGMAAGNGHNKMKYPTFDRDWELLSGRVDSEALEFYKNLQKSIYYSELI